MPRYDVVIVGTGHAGTQAAAALRKEKYAGSVAMLGEFEMTSGSQANAVPRSGTGGPAGAVRAPASPPATFRECWADAVRCFPDEPFLRFLPDGTGTGDPAELASWSYAQFDAVVARVSATLSAAGVGNGSAVHVVLRNCPAFVAIWLAVARLGAWFVPVDPVSSPRDIDLQVRRTSPTVAIVAKSRSGVYREGAAARDVPVIELTEDASDVMASSPLLTCAATALETPVGPDDRLAVMFTSGTTAEPKGVDLTQANYAHVAHVMAEFARLEARHRWLVTLPLFHANAQYYCFAPSIAAGASVVLTATFSASRWVEQARRLGATHASLFAAPIRMILARCPETQQPASLEHVWFAQSLGEQHYERFARLAGTRPRQLYGMTETVAIVCADRAAVPRSDVIGHPVEGRRVAIELGDGTQATAGTPGQLIVQGTPGRDLFRGYLHDQAATQRAFRHTGNGTWFATGDLVCANQAGELRFVGRVDDVVKVAGENVSLTEVEAVAAQAPGILEVAVVAKADDVRDVVPVAYFVARDSGAPPTEDQLREWAKGNLPPAARPREWHQVDELPRTSVGKVRRFRING
jgi:carnitine-CoA ligase